MIVYLPGLAHSITLPVGTLETSAIVSFTASTPSQLIPQFITRRADTVTVPLALHSWLTLVALSCLAAVVVRKGLVHSHVFSTAFGFASLIFSKILLIPCFLVRHCISSLAIADCVCREVTTVVHVWLTHELQHQVRVQFLVAAATVLICPLKRQVTLSLFSALEEGLRNQVHSEIKHLLH